MLNHRTKNEVNQFYIHGFNPLKLFTFYCKLHHIIYYNFIMYVTNMYTVKYIFWVAGSWQTPAQTAAVTVRVYRLLGEAFISVNKAEF